MRCVTHRFDENYVLAATQNSKNKDIPKGGVKGTILPHHLTFMSVCRLKLAIPHGLGTNPQCCFEKYVDVSAVAEMLAAC
jgi:glutamate dehydrogenase